MFSSLRRGLRSFGTRRTFSVKPSTEKKKYQWNDYYRFQLIGFVTSFTLIGVYRASTEWKKDNEPYQKLPRYLLREVVIGGFYGSVIGAIPPFTWAILIKELLEDYFD